MSAKMPFPMGVVSRDRDFEGLPIRIWSSNWTFTLAVNLPGSSIKYGTLNLGIFDPPPRHKLSQMSDPPPPPSSRHARFKPSYSSQCHDVSITSAAILLFNNYDLINQADIKA